MTFTFEPLFRDPKAQFIVVLHVLDLLELGDKARVLGFVEALYCNERDVCRLQVRNLTFERGRDTFRAYVEYSKYWIKVASGFGDDILVSGLGIKIQS
jgi:hypothetical protein